MMKEDWIEQLRQKLEGHEVEPPEGLWESICSKMKEMDYEIEPVSQEPVNRKSVSRRWYWVAAAAVLALVGFFVFPKGNDGEQPLQAEVIAQKGEGTSPQLQAGLQPPPLTPPLEGRGVAAHPTTETVLQATDKPQQTTTETLQITVEPQQTITEAQQATGESKQISKEQRAEKSDNRTIAENYDEQNHHLSHLSALSSHPNKWSVGLNASGGLLAANTSQRMDRVYLSNSEVGLYSFAEYSISSYTMTEYESKHHLPVRFGLSLDYQLSPRLALNSGITYTYLYSEFNIPLYQNAHFTQKLHYLGIPVGVTWLLWSTDRFRFYVSGGVMLEKCVSAKYDVEGMEGKKPWQWSLNAAAGAEYTFIPQLGFYLEPSLGYNFDDGTSLEHYYKEHPLTPSIEFGLRLHLSK